MPALVLPAVAALDGAPIAGAEEILASLAAVDAKGKKPSGAWYRKNRDAIARGLGPLPRPDEPRPDEPRATNDAPRLTAADVAAVEEETAHEETRTALLTIGRADLERRVGSLGAMGFWLGGILLGDEETWQLNDTQRENLAVLFVEAFPDECAKLVQEGSMAKVLAIGTLGQVIREKWRVYRAPKPERAAAPATKPAAPRAPAGPRPFTGLPDMRVQ